MATATRTYEIFKGVFKQDESFEPGVAVPPRFGLVNSSTDRWIRLLDTLEKLNKSASRGVTYKLIIAGRHGQGMHNMAKLIYGAELWDGYWSKLDGDGKVSWGPDPLLSSLGEEQARDVQAMWKQEATAGIPLPRKLYCSPMTRALQTCRLSFADIIDLTKTRPLILENCREVYGVHSCDKRRTLSYLRASFPEFDVEKGFTEEDELYDPNVREEHTHVIERAHLVLDHIFDCDEESVISITAHAGFISGLSAAAGHVPVVMPTGGVLPMVVKSTVGQVFEAC